MKKILNFLLFGICMFLITAVFAQVQSYTLVFAWTFHKCALKEGTPLIINAIFDNNGAHKVDFTKNMRNTKQGISGHGIMPASKEKIRKINVVMARGTEITQLCPYMVIRKVINSFNSRKHKVNEIYLTAKDPNQVKIPGVGYNWSCKALFAQ